MENFQGTEDEQLMSPGVALKQVAKQNNCKGEAVRNEQFGAKFQEEISGEFHWIH